MAERMPSEVGGRPGIFDRFATRASRLASRAPFFVFCLLLVVSWLTQGLVTILVTGDPKRFVDQTYQLEINTTTTIITFLLVALLQNSQMREDKATQHKLNAIADALADLMDNLAERQGDESLRRDVGELKQAVGLEERESSDEEHAKSG